MKGTCKKCGKIYYGWGLLIDKPVTVAESLLLRE